MTESNILPSKKKEDIKFENKLRPTHIEEFIGQKKKIENLKTYIEGATKRKEPLDHVLFHGPPGLGKTTLANIIAAERGVQIKQTSGPVLEKKGDITALLTELETYDVLFIDEIHRLKTSLEEILYKAMEDFQVDVIMAFKTFFNKPRFAFAQQAVVNKHGYEVFADCFME